MIEFIGIHHCIFCPIYYYAFNFNRSQICKVDLFNFHFVNL